MRKSWVSNVSDIAAWHWEDREKICKTKRTKCISMLQSVFCIIRLTACVRAGVTGYTWKYWSKLTVTPLYLQRANDPPHDVKYLINIFFLDCGTQVCYSQSLLVSSVCHRNRRVCIFQSAIDSWISVVWDYDWHTGNIRNLMVGQPSWTIERNWSLEN